MTIADPGSALDRPALARLIARSQARFAAETWGRAPLLSRAEDLPGPFGDLFSLEAVDELVANRALRTPFVRMADEGTLLDAKRYTSPGGFGAEVGDQLDSAKVLREFAGGATLVLQGLHRTWQPIADFTRALVADLAHPAQVNAYVTPAASRGFDPHYDVHDVFVIQIAGEKHWRIHAPVHPDPLRDQPWTDHRDAVAARALEEPAIDAVFAPGDVLYLPRGWIHSATALGGTSVHLTIGVSALTRWEVVQRLVSAASAEASLRSSLPLGVDYLDTDAMEAVVRETVEALTGALRPSPGIGASLRRKVGDSMKPEPVAPMRFASLEESSVVRWRAGLSAVVRLDGDAVRIEAEGRTISLPAEAFDAVDSLRQGMDAVASSLRNLDAASSLVVARRLVREGVLVIA